MWRPKVDSKRDLRSTSMKEDVGLSRDSSCHYLLEFRRCVEALCERFHWKSGIVLFKFNAPRT